MGIISSVLPVLLILFLILFFVYFWKAQMPQKGTSEWVVLSKNKIRGEALKCHALGRRDWVILLIVTLSYAIVTFVFLGTTKVPMTFYRYQPEDGELIMHLEQPTEVSKVWYYNGLNRNNHEGKTFDMMWSEDSYTWSAPQSLDRAYSTTFRWKEFEFPAGTTLQYVSLSLDRTSMDLGEFVLLDKDGVPVPAEQIFLNRGSAAAIFDEQETVPEVRSILTGTYFDEIYHAYTAYEYIQGWYPYENTHPPLGKIFTMFGIKIFGMNPFGWRFFPALFGVLMVPFFYVLAHNMFGKTWVSLCGTLVFTYDFMHFVQTRISTIDTYGVFFIIAMYLFMYRWLTSQDERRFSRAVPNLILCGISFGLGAASKWICLYAALGLIVLFVWALVRSWLSMRKEDSHLFPPHFWKTIVVSLVFFIVVPVGIYLASYIPYIKPEQPKSLKTLVEVCWDNQKTMLSYHSGLNTDKVTTPTEGVLVDIWQSVGSTVKEGDVLGIVKEGPTDHQIRADQDGRIIKVNKKIRATVSAGETLFVMRVGGHPFESKWYQWLVDVRPVFYFISTYPEEIGDTTVNMRASSSTFNSPIVSWGGLIALLSMVGLLLYWKKHIAWFILIGYFSQLVPWLGISRTTYAYHYFPSVVFLVLAICCIFDTWMERDSQLVTRIHIGAWKLPTAKRMILIFTCVTVGIFVLFYPVLAALPVPEWFISDFLRWFPSWPI